MKIVVDPPLAGWSPGPRKGNCPPVIATGHQAALWHPGILAKDMAMAATAKRFGGSMLHIVVDSDVHETMRVDLPMVADGKLSVKTVQLGPVDAQVPTGMQPGIDAGAAAEKLEQLRDGVAVDVGALIDGLRALPSVKTLAEQAAVLAAQLMRPYVGDVPLCYASDLLKDAGDLIDAMLEDARGCVGEYNQTAGAHPAAGIAGLTVEPDRVELPLWCLAWGEPRRRVFADLADSKPLLTDDRGEVIEDRGRLAPKALLLTAVMRSRCCDLFIHGTGGYVYDRITEDWWRSWRGEALSPMALATADLYLDLDVPVADGEAVARAVWWRHHLAHNLDRHVAVDRATAERKRTVLAHMDDDRDRVRRANGFAEVHRINRELAAAHGDAVAAAERRLRDARLGAQNRGIARRRDWCFAIYPEEKLRSLGEGFSGF